MPRLFFSPLRNTDFASDCILNLSERQVAGVVKKVGSTMLFCLWTSGVSFEVLKGNGFGYNNIGTVLSIIGCYLSIRSSSKACLEMV
jgi:hypothetical protein